MKLKRYWPVLECQGKKGEELLIGYKEVAKLLRHKFDKLFKIIYNTNYKVLE